jgi:cellobiose transport system permease protein
MRSASRRMWQASPLTYVALIVAGVLSILPLYFMFVIATKRNDNIHDTPPPFLPGGEFGKNFGNVLDGTKNDAHFIYGLMNSVIVATCVTIGIVLFGSLAGFAFAKLKFRGRGALLIAIVGTMMVPTQLGIIPLYMLMAKFGWQDGDLRAVIVPFLVSGFGVFMMRQYASQSISDELIEAARVDGCSTFRIFWSIVLPVLRPAAAVLGLLTFMQYWNDFLWPFVVLTPDTPTVQTSLTRLATAYYTDYAMVFAATAVATLPLVLVFIVFGKQIIGGIMEGAVKA